jgi:hypothetical protein
MWSHSKSLGKFAGASQAKMRPLRPIFETEHGCFIALIPCPTLENFRVQIRWIAPSK